MFCINLFSWFFSLKVTSQEMYGTLGAIVKSRTGNRQVGFLTNRHVAVDLDYPNQKMFHPLPPSVGPGVYLGAVERATSFITDDLWYGIFAGTNPGKVVPIFHLQFIMNILSLVVYIWKFCLQVLFSCKIVSGCHVFNSMKLVHCCFQ